jgi:hypothetical protein
MRKRTAAADRAAAIAYLEIFDAGVLAGHSTKEITG